jgi:hypothetical protein
MEFGFCWPLNLTSQHNRYVLVMIERFSKWLKLVPLLDCNSEGITYAFLDMVLNRFKALAKGTLTKVHNFVGSSKNCVRKH